MSEPNKVWQIDKKDVFPICDSCYEIFKEDKLLTDLGNPYGYIGKETEYRYWKDQSFCIFCYIKKKIEDKK